MGKGIHRDRRVVDAEPDDVAAITQGGDGGVVRAEHQPGGGRERGEHVLPAIGDGLELAVPVELIAEQVHQHDGPGVHALGHGGQGRLVALEQPARGGPVAGTRAGKGGGHAGEQVRARPIGDELGAPGAQRTGQQPRCGGLAIGGRHQSGATAQACGQRANGTRVDLEQHDPGHRCAAAAPEGA